MAEYVDREAIREKACKGCTMRDGASGCWNADPCETLVSEFVSAYAADVAPVVHGRWIEKADHATCSACLSDCWSSSALGYDYCPECGAKMDGGSDHE